MLRVVVLQEPSESPSILNIEHYVPISFRSRSRPIPGARLIRFGDFKAQLLELQFTVESLALRGFTLVVAGKPGLHAPAFHLGNCVFRKPRYEAPATTSLSTMPESKASRKDAMKLLVKLRTA